MSPEEEARLALLEKSLLDLQANDPEKLTRQLTLRAGRVRALARHLKEVEAALSEEAVAAVFEHEGKAAVRARRPEAPRGDVSGRHAGWNGFGTLDGSLGSGTPVLAGAGLSWPGISGRGERCALRAVSAGPRSRSQPQAQAVRGVRRFDDGKGTPGDQGNFRAAQERPSPISRPRPKPLTKTLKEIRIEHEAVADAIAAALATSENRRKAVVLALTEDKDLAADCPALASVAHEADALAEQIEARIKTLRTSATDDTRKRMTAEVQELRARKLLAKHEQTVLDDIERRKKYRRLRSLHRRYEDASDHAEEYGRHENRRFTEAQAKFQDELVNLAFRHVEVELKEVGGAEGVLYHKLILTRAPGVELPRVVSEGEQRCLSIAAFFAELSTADDPSGIVFDDPVSSLDYKWREGVARRLVQEAKTRQVIVFTHDVVFLLLLKQFAEEQGVEQLDQHVRHLSKGAGVCAEELPWVALPVKKKIGYLKNEWQAADKLFRDGHQAAYEKEAKYLYGLLREAWERALEEVLLGGVVERFRPGVQTQHIGTIADITAEDCRTLIPR